MIFETSFVVVIVLHLDSNKFLKTIFWQTFLFHVIKNAVRKYKPFVFVTSRKWIFGWTFQIWRTEKFHKGLQ